MRKSKAVATAAAAGLALFVLSATEARAQVTNTFICTNTPLAIPDSTAGGPAVYGPNADVTCPVSMLPGAITALSVNMTLSPMHTWVGDLDVTLNAPSAGPSMVIYSRTGATTAGSFGFSSDIGGPYTFADTAATNWWTAAAVNPVAAGTYRTTAPGPAANPAPVTSLNAIFGGMTSTAANGTWILRFRDGAGGDVGTVSAASIAITQSLSNNGDFNSDGNTDFLFRHGISGKNVAWFMDGITRLAGTFTNPDSLPDTNWQMVGTNDFSTPQDGKPDIVFRHYVSGKNVVWYMDGITRTAGVFTNPDTLADTNWRIVGTGDFSTPNDGKPDLLFRHAVTGKNVVWYMDGITRTAGVFTNPDQLADTNWFMVGIGDFWSAGGGQDGNSDILWRHNFSGKNVLWYMDGITRTLGVFTNPDQLPDTNWRMVAVGDYSTPNDARPDIVFRHQISGKNVVWYMIGATRTGGVFTNPDQLADTYWRIVGPR